MAVVILPWHLDNFFFFCRNKFCIPFLLPEAAEERPQPGWLILAGQLVSTNTSFMAPVPPAVQFTCSYDSWWLWRQSPRTSPEQQFSWATVSMCLQVKIKSKLPASWNTCRSLKTQWIWYAWKHGLGRLGLKGQGTHVCLLSLRSWLKQIPKRRDKKTMKHKIDVMLKRQGLILWLTIEGWLFTATQTARVRSPDHRETDRSGVCILTIWLCEH